MTSPLAIIPAAGYGVRVGSPTAKELFLHPSGKTLIDHTIDLALDLGCDPLVISRKDKVELNHYVQKRNINLIIIEPTLEWTETVVKTSPYFQEKNILLLPDTDWGEIKIARNMLQALDKKDFSIATLKIDNPALWGIIEKREENIYFAEKPKETQSKLAWGIIAFKKNWGQEFWPKLHESSQNHLFIEGGKNYQLFALDWYRDLTR